MQIWRPKLFHEQVNVRLDHQSFSWLQTQAEQDALSLSGYVRRLILEHAKRDLQLSAAGDDDHAAA